MTTLADFVATKPRFGRSANVERDHGAQAVEGYLPTGRAIDVVKRVAEGLMDARAGRTFSITGPHGGGKSSLAVFVSALLSADSSPEYKASIKLLRAADAETARLMVKARKQIGANGSGFVTAAAAARSESVAKTAARAVKGGVHRYLGETHPLALLDEQAESAVLSSLRAVCSERPVLLVIDEFGKNLEAYARAKNEGDPYLLQEIAEATQGQEPLPLIVFTMQHLAFDEYVQEASAARRREWAKVQGRFQDIPYLETAEQSRRLIVESIDQSAPVEAAAAKYVRHHSKTLAALNLRELEDDARASIPLHPLTLAVLPDLCSRYGQNERTLFSFIAGTEPRAVPNQLKKLEWSQRQDLRLIGLDRVYDYFVESSGSAVGVSSGASRWLEIEMRIRDTAGLSEPELRAIKTIGLLNLVSSGGKIRASRDILEFALGTGDCGTRTSNEITKVLGSLERRGLISHRTFSDEFRIWQGSDFDLRRAIGSARRQVGPAPLADLLNHSADLQPVVAGRHSQSSGVLRIFGQTFGDPNAPIELSPDWDGVVLYAAGSHGASGTVESANPRDDDVRPVIVVESDDLTDVRAAAVEAAALKLALEAAEDEGADWVATRELSERAAAAHHQLLSAIAATWGTESEWHLLESDQPIDPAAGLSSVLSAVSDTTFAKTPPLRNEMAARRELTSQGAKARRVLIDAMIESSGAEAFGIEGYGPERAMYESLLRWTGIHRKRNEASWSLGEPTEESWRALWRELNDVIDAADDERKPLDHVLEVAKRPPYGLKDGVLPLLAVSILLARRDEIALYEHGSLVLELDDAVAERLTKNPFHFAIRNSATRGASRSAVVKALADRLQIKGPSGTDATFLNVTTALFRELRILPPYTQKTKFALSRRALEVRNAFHTATEPDVLIFETLPAVLGMAPFQSKSRTNVKRAAEFADELADIVLEMRSVYTGLLNTIAGELGAALAVPGDLEYLHQRLVPRAVELHGRVLEQRLKGFVGALSRDLPPQPWLENVAMVIAEGHAPRVWTDDIAERFPLSVAELGGAMRRTEALLYDSRARSSDRAGFQAARVTLTQADGTEWNELVAITDDDRGLIETEFEDAIDRLTSKFGSRAAACRMLMARLAIDELGTVGDSAVTAVPRGVRHG
ncbi:hypothetical protein IA539_14715 [Gordonia sp. zg691]|uniref:hypothetical protein n=1 Tax=Gordonia jinghuaiqii TaxID=2758710 RepID=UPI00166275C9|nr:hypothetical protein [Gordonia jinghuaiqii]MBD0862456.1 hypothetical protein [Gordonia jinghuaiqii]